mmetsp:Transcript_12180/g.23572  ORF Transcript_12180/g.23572 Transcript_12180/m.23572 type:complete len:225 (-) Transcript_12180:548-1222(-)
MWLLYLFIIFFFFFFSLFFAFPLFLILRLVRFVLILFVGLPPLGIRTLRNGNTTSRPPGSLPESPGLKKEALVSLLSLPSNSRCVFSNLTCRPLPLRLPTCLVLPIHTMSLLSCVLCLLPRCPPLLIGVLWEECRQVSVGLSEEADCRGGVHGLHRNGLPVGEGAVVLQAHAPTETRQQIGVSCLQVSELASPHRNFFEFVPAEIPLSDHLLEGERLGWGDEGV